MFDVLFMSRAALFPGGGELPIGAGMAAGSEPTDAIIDPIRFVQRLADEITNGWEAIPEGDRHMSIKWHGDTFIRCHICATAKGPDGTDGYYMTGHKDGSLAHSASLECDWTVGVSDGVMGGALKSVVTHDAD